MNATFTDKRAQSAFTLVEVLAALMFMSIVIPVAVQGLRVANMAGEAAERKSQAARMAERLLNESLVMTNWLRSQKGTIMEGVREYDWTLRSEKWNQDASAYAPTLVTVEVRYPVQDRECSVRLSTLATTP
jgi:Tfp pilus assembly protein PilV